MEIGLLLPYNVIVYERDRGGTVVAAIDTVAALGIADNPDLADLAATVGEKLKRVIESIEA